MELEREYPCFCMPAQLRLAEPIGIHFFEPRYRRRIAPRTPNPQPTP